MNGKTGYEPYQAGVTDADAVVRPSVTKEGTLRCNLHKTWVWIPFDLAGMTGHTDVVKGQQGRLMCMSIPWREVWELV